MLNDEQIAEAKRRALEEDMQDPGFRRGWDRIEDLHRRAKGYDAAVAERDALKAAISDVLCRMATTRAWAYRELSGGALSNVHRVIDHLWGVLDPDRSIHPALAIPESPEDAPTAMAGSDVRRFAADVARLVKDYSNEERGVIALTPFEATLDQLCLEKYGFDLDRVAALAVPESHEEAPTGRVARSSRPTTKIRQDPTPLVARDVRRALDDLAPGTECPTSCDADCEAGPTHCAEVHVVRWQRGHDPENCPKDAPTGGED